MIILELSKTSNPETRNSGKQSLEQSQFTFRDTNQEINDPYALYNGETLQHKQQTPYIWALNELELVTIANSFLKFDIL